MIHPYIIVTDAIRNSLIADCEYDADPYAYADIDGCVYVITNDIYELMYRAFDGFPVDGVRIDNLHPATRKEIKEAGLWDYVINKEDYSSEQDQLETELEEYLKLGEEE